MRTSEQQKIKMEVVIVDDNSPDGTQEQIKALQKIYGEDKIVSVALVEAAVEEAPPAAEAPVTEAPPTEGENQ